jgi:hypothetical protein
MVHEIGVDGLSMRDPNADGEGRSRLNNEARGICEPTPAISQRSLAIDPRSSHHSEIADGSELILLERP